MPYVSRLWTCYGLVWHCEQYQAKRNADTDLVTSSIDQIKREKREEQRTTSLKYQQLDPFIYSCFICISKDKMKSGWASVSIIYFVLKGRWRLGLVLALGSFLSYISFFFVDEIAIYFACRCIILLCILYPYGFGV